MASKYLEAYGNAAFELGPQSVIRYTAKGKTRDLEKPNLINGASVILNEFAYRLPHEDRHIALNAAVRLISTYLSHLTFVQKYNKKRST